MKLRIETFWQIKFTVSQKGYFTTKLHLCQVCIIGFNIQNPQMQKHLIKLPILKYIIFAIYYNIYTLYIIYIRNRNDIP